MVVGGLLVLQPQEFYELPLDRPPLYRLAALLGPQRVPRGLQYPTSVTVRVSDRKGTREL